MYTIIYVCAIVLVILGIVLFFVLRKKKDKKQLDNFKKTRAEQAEKIIKNDETALSLSQEIEKTPEEKKKMNVVLEDFSLDSKPTNKNTDNKTSQNGDLDDNFIPFNSQDENNDFEESDEEFFDKKFAEYEKFLKENLDSEDDDEDSYDENSYDEEENNDELDALMNFDYNSLKGKSDEEIAELIKTLPPKAQEILMTDILGKKKYDDKED